MPAVWLAEGVGVAAGVTVGTGVCAGVGVGEAGANTNNALLCQTVVYQTHTKSKTITTVATQNHGFLAKFLMPTAPRLNYPILSQSQLPVHIHQSRRVITECKFMTVMAKWPKVRFTITTKLGEPLKLQMAEFDTILTVNEEG